MLVKISGKAWVNGDLKIFLHEREVTEITICGKVKSLGDFLYLGHMVKLKGTSLEVTLYFGQPYGVRHHPENPEHAAVTTCDPYRLEINVGERITGVLEMLVQVEPSHEELVALARATLKSKS